MGTPLDLPMTPEQAEILKALALRAGDPQAFDAALTSGEADRRILALETLLASEQNGGKERLPRT